VPLSRTRGDLAVSRGRLFDARPAVALRQGLPVDFVCQPVAELDSPGTAAARRYFLSTLAPVTKLMDLQSGLSEDEQREVRKEFAEHAFVGRALQVQAGASSNPFGRKHDAFGVLTPDLIHALLTAGARSGVQP
jgi:hypothetical protein